MEISPLDPTAGALAPGTAPEESAFVAPDLGRDEFLKLLVAKLQNQDPLKPSEDAAFVAELATFSSLEQLIQANEKLASLEQTQLDTANSQAWDMIGKDALVDGGGAVQIRDGRPDGIVYAMPRAAKDAVLTVTDTAGNVVREISLDKAPNGAVSLDWHGALDEDGESLPDGDYRIEIEAHDASDTAMIVPWFRSLRIDAVSFFDGNVSLISQGREIPFESILEIREGRF